jgi:putative MFS transporter
MFDALDSGLVSFVLAVLAKEWLLTPGQTGWVGSAGMAGMFFGAIASGMLADRLGRKTVFLATLLVFSISTGLCGLAAGFLSLCALRFLVGFGLGGELPVASALVSEFAPSAHRGKLVVFLESFWAFGWAAAALVAWLFIPVYGWRAAFFLGALPALYTLYLRRGIPESPRFLLARGRADDAERIVAAIERECGVASPPAAMEEAPAMGAGPVPGETGLRALWSPARARRTAMLWVLWFSMVYSYYGIFIWLPTLLVASGHTIVKSFEYVLIITIAQIPGYFSAAWLVDRLGRKPVLAVYLFGCAAACAGFGFLASTDVSIVVWGCLISFFNLGAWGVVYTYTPESYPTALRASGAGWAAGIGRIGGILAPLAIGWILAARPGNSALVFGHVAALLLVAVGTVLALGEETRGRSLESLSS